MQPILVNVFQMNRTVGINIYNKITWLDWLVQYRLGSLTKVGLRIEKLKLRRQSVCEHGCLNRPHLESPKTWKPQVFGWHWKTKEYVFQCHHKWWHLKWEYRMGKFIHKEQSWILYILPTPWMPSTLLESLLHLMLSVNILPDFPRGICLEQEPTLANLTTELWESIKKMNDHVVKVSK